MAFISPFKISHTWSKYCFGRIKDGGPLSHCCLICKCHLFWQSPKKQKVHVQKFRLFFSCSIQRICYSLGLTIQSKIGTEPIEVTGSLWLPKSTTEFSVSWSKPFTGTEPPGKWKAKLIKQQLNTTSSLDLPLQKLCGFRALPQQAGTWTVKVFTFNLIWLSSIAISFCLCFCGPPALHSCSSQTLLPRRN